MKKVSALDEFTRVAAVSLDRVDRFAELSRARQLDILTTLRGRGVEDNLELPLFAIIVPIVVSVSIGLSDHKPFAGPLRATYVAMAIVGFGISLVVMTVIGVPLLLRERRRKNALIWLAAYEDELVRRRAMGGSAGRRWRKAH